jgi:hypothetical protein
MINSLLLLTTSITVYIYSVLLSRSFLTAHLLRPASYCSCISSSIHAAKRTRNEGQISQKHLQWETGTTANAPDTDLFADRDFAHNSINAKQQS